MPVKEDFENRSIFGEDMNKSMWLSTVSTIKAKSKSDWRDELAHPKFHENPHAILGSWFCHYVICFPTAELCETEIDNIARHCVRTEDDQTNQRRTTGCYCLL